MEVLVNAYFYKKSKEEKKDFIEQDHEIKML